jgi:3-hydroxyisobutyrate dehydrogenase-like beta-hydroxyacid dehydrogenase
VLRMERFPSSHPATNIVMAFEAIEGLNTRDVFEAINKSTGWSWMLENRGPHMLANDYLAIYFVVSIILKTLGL